MEEPRPSIQSERNHFGVQHANGCSDRVDCTKRFEAPSSTCISASSSVFSRDDECADVFRSFSGSREAPYVPFLEFVSDFDADTGKKSGVTYSDIFGGISWDLAVSLEELLGEWGTGDENKDLENDCREKMRSSASSLTQIRGRNLKEGVCNSRSRSLHLEMIYETEDDSENKNSEPHEVFLTITEIHLQTQPTQRPPPSRPPPKLETRHSDSERNLGSGRKDCRKNGIRRTAKRNHRNHKPIVSEISVVGISKNTTIAASDSVKEVRIEKEEKLKIPMESPETGDTPGTMLSDRNGKRSKQRKECKSIHEFFELASHGGSKLEETRKERNTSLGVLQVTETESLDTSSAKKAFHQGVLSKATSVHKTTAQASKQVRKTSSMVEKVVPEERDSRKVELAQMFTASSREMPNEGDQSELYDGTSTVNILKQSYDLTRKINSMWHGLSFKKKKNLQSDGSPLASHSISNHQEFEFETEERRMARSQRFQRTADRVAKALAEKKNRDFLAQKEQTERSRLAETLDSDIKRWSNGKEGNLRALLSTLQYILWLESGWQPVALTDIITADAVKKAYRKATLCVHPDKVQQKGASIQQKYIAEKVFYLLKDAWNKFNYEEC